MDKQDNLLILQRLLEICKNELNYSVYPKEFKDEHIFLSLKLTPALHQLESEFSKSFQQAVGRYKSNLEHEGKGYGWFHNPEHLCWVWMEIQQLEYIIWGHDSRRPLKFNSELGNDAYRDFICQIDRTVLMNEDELKEHRESCNKIAKEIVDRMIKDGEL